MHALPNVTDRPFGLPPTRHVIVELLGVPVAKGRPRFWNGRCVTPPKTRAYERDLQYAARLAMHGHPPIPGPLKVEVLAAFPVPQSWPKNKQTRAIAGIIRPTTRPDWENIAKVLDAFNGVVWLDDAQVVQGSVRKVYSVEPRLRVEVEALFTGAA